MNNIIKRIVRIFYSKKYRDGCCLYRIVFFRIRKKYKFPLDCKNISSKIDKKDENIVKLPTPDVYKKGRCTYCNADTFIASKDTSIGSFCSIGMHVVLGHGEHPIQMLTSSPFLYLDCLGFKSYEMPSHNEFLTIKPITIGNDVWIGDGVFVKNGVTIGDGSIIGARAVVTKDVPPYSIVVGAPAKILRWRFPESIRNELLELKWWNLDDNIIRNIPYENINDSLAFLRKIRSIRPNNNLNFHNKKDIKRLGVYFFYDKDGKVDLYVTYFLRSLRYFCSELCVVVNGRLQEDSKILLEDCCDVVLERDNFGLDAWAYKYAFEYYGYENLKAYDEVLCCNFTVFGPFYPLHEVFDTMNKRNCDWWGLHTWWTPTPVDYDHIPSYFVVYRKSIIENHVFKDYWQTLNVINTYEESVEFHEQRQTPYYDSYGFCKSTYLDSTEYSKLDHFGWPLKLADRPIIEKRFPFVKRRCFYVGDGKFEYKHAVVNIIQFLKKESSYDLSMIYNNIIRTQDFTFSKITYYRYKILSMVSLSKRHRLRYHEKYNSYILREEFLNMMKQ